MRKKIFILLSIAFFAGATMVSCKPPQKGGKTKGRQQPKNGKMPCPQKDC